jgi:tripartite-type tricarboxylate transporter receptor subunit TctC
MPQKVVIDRLVVQLWERAPCTKQNTAATAAQKSGLSARGTRRSSRSAVIEFVDRARLRAGDNQPGNQGMKKQVSDESSFRRKQAWPPHSQDRASAIPSSKRGSTMNTLRRLFLALALSVAALPAGAPFASAQTYPTRPVRIVVGYAAGGGTDLVARLMGQWLSERLGQQFVVENRTGAATNIGTEAVVRAPADGYTLLLTHTANAINATLYEKLNFNFIRDITPVAGIIRVPGVMVVNPSLPAKTVLEFIAYAKANPGKINMASGGAGGPDHMSGELFKTMTGVIMIHVPDRGLSPALSDLLAGQVQVIFSSLPAAIEYIKADKLRALAVTTATRFEGAPDIPTVGDVVPSYEASQWYGVGAPKNMPVEIVEKLKQGDQCGPRQSQAKGAACRPRGDGTSWPGRRFREAHRGRNRKVGQGGEVLGCQAGLISNTVSIFHIVRSANGQVSCCFAAIATALASRPVYPG